MSHQCHATVIRWIDGDTVVINAYPWPGITVTEHIRLADVDTAEAGKPGYNEAKARVNELCPAGSRVTVALVGDWDIQNMHKRTFARLPGHIYPDGISKSLSRTLADEHLTKADFQ